MILAHFESVRTSLLHLGLVQDESIEGPSSLSSAGRFGVGGFNDESELEGRGRWKVIEASGPATAAARVPIARPTAVDASLRNTRLSAADSVSLPDPLESTAVAV